jgi:hypothetical protein
MPIRISGVSHPLDEPETNLPIRLGRVLGLAPENPFRWRILRKSLDARDKDALRFVYTLEVTLPEDEDRIVALAQRVGGSVPRVELYSEAPFFIPDPGSQHLEHRPVVVGSGPAGLLAAYFLAEQGYSPLVLERGREVRQRISDVRAFDRGLPLDPESNYLFGEGGAGTFSDGKLTCRSSGPDIHRVLELFAQCKGKPSIRYEHRPHLGSNRLPAVVKAFRQRIVRMGGEFRFSCRLEDLTIKDGRLTGLVTSAGFLPATVAILAIGHSARDTYEMLLRRNVPMVHKPFQMGVRIEQPQETVNRVHYGSARWEDQLGAADYSLVARGRHDLFTFCMCAGGEIIPSVSEAGYFCTNGMSLSKRQSPFANSGLMITVNPEHFAGTDIMAGVRLQQIYERKAFAAGREEYLCPIQSATDFLAHRKTRGLPPCSYPRGLVSADMAELIPSIIVDSLHHGLPLLDGRWQGRFLAEATLVGPEARGSSPIRLVRHTQSRQSPAIEGLYPVGEGAGYAGGIISAAVDGLRSAKAVMAKYAKVISH